MGLYDPENPLIPRLREVIERLFEMGEDDLSEHVEEAIAVLEGRLVLGEDGRVKLPAAPTS